MQPKFCKDCGSELMPNAVFCENCGARVCPNIETNQTVQESISQIPTQPQMNRQPTSSQINQPIASQPPQEGVYPQDGVPYVNKPQKNTKEIAGILIGIVLLLSVVLVIVFLSRGNKKDQLQDNQSIETRKSETTERQSEGVQQDNALDEAEKILDLGEAGHYEGLSIKINSISAPDSEELYDHPKEGMEYILLNVEITNESNDVLNCPRRNSFTLVIDEVQYGSDMRSVYVPEGDKDKYGGDPIEPGQTHLFSPLYQVPAGTRNYEVLYVPGFDGRKLTYQFSIDSIAESDTTAELPESESDTTAELPESESDTTAELPESESDTTAESPKSESTSESEIESSQFSTTGKPEAKDFTWFTENAQNWKFGDIPAEAQISKTAVEIGGSWKGLEMIYDYDGTLMGYRYFTAFIDSNSTDVNITLTIDWKNVDWSDGAHEELDSWPDESMEGFFEIPTFYVGTGGNQISFVAYEYDGKQYAEGNWTLQSGEESRVALVRP